MLLFGLIAVSVARGQVQPDGIWVADPTLSSSNNCDGNGPHEAMMLTQDDNTGNIGIGTCNWSANLTIQAFAKVSNTAVEIVAQNGDGNTPPYNNLSYLLKVHTLTPPGFAPPGGIGTPASDNPLLVVTDAGQSVGIGTYKPLATLHVVNINASQKIPALWVQNQTGKGNIDALYVGKSGLVGIDNSSPQAALNITNYNDGNGIPALWVQNASSGDAMYIDPNGNVGIDNESPAYPLDVTGDAHATNLYIDGTTWNTGNVNVGQSITVSGIVQIGGVSTPNIFDPSTNPTGYKLYVQGGIMSEQYKCAMSNTSYWTDYVFDKDYKLASLNEVEKYIKDNHHLPDVPSTEDVQCEGIDMAKMDATLLKKIEELTLYMLDLKKENTQMKAEIANLKK